MIDMLIKDYQAKIDSRLDIILSESGQLYDEVLRACHYSVLNGGKRIRPILLLEFYKLCGGDDDCAYNFACALEMIHSYSLVHDDLPCMDNDDFRRGKPSCHKEFG
ncbi:MAG: polyprenyl synthetase family protein, partial [Acutalibacteraceae bacterium]